MILGIQNNEKYAIVALPRLPLDWQSVPQFGELALGLEFAQRLPFGLDGDWKKSIGTIRSDQLTKSQLILIAKMESKTPGVLDDENEQLKGLVLRLYQGLQLAAPIWVNGEVVLLTGANIDNKIGVRQISTIDPPSSIHFGETPLINTNDLNTAAKLVPVMSGFPKGQYLRLCRILNAYFFGVKSNDWRERLHQFCRCIEGLILPEVGKTEKQFKSRTELFVGPQHHGFMGSLYRNRSAVEHMNDPVIDAPSQKEKIAKIMEFTLISEHIARHCILNVMLSKNLLEKFVDDAALNDFWSLDASGRAELWGPQLNINEIKTLYERRIEEQTQAL